MTGFSSLGKLSF